ncbi:MAG: hypothetical protein R3F20_10575 [Planctomycetota bacterium]
MKKLAWMTMFALLFGAFGVIDQVRAQEEKTLEERMAEIDPSDPDQLFEVANWAMKDSNSKTRREGRKLMAEVLELDSDHGKAREALGHVKVGDTWYKSKKEADKAKLELLEAEMIEKGYVKFRNGFIKKDVKRDWDKTWQMDDNLIWKSEADIMAERGFRKIQGVWVQMSEADLERADRHRKMTGEDLIVTTTAHYRFHFMAPPKFAQQYSAQIEKLYDWFFDTFKAGELVGRDRCEVFGGGRVDVWCFNSPQQFQDWVTTYQEEYQFDAEDKKQFRERPNGYLIAGKRLVIVVQEKAEDMENPLLHQNGIMLLAWFGLYRPAPWMREAFGHLCEHLFSTEKYGRVNNTTNSKYGGQGGIAGKEFNTKDMPPAMKAIVKLGDDIDIERLSMLPLNSLNGDHLAQGFSHIEWMYNHKLEQLIQWFHAMRSLRIDANPQKNEEYVTAYVQAVHQGRLRGLDDREVHERVARLREEELPLIPAESFLP